MKRQVLIASALGFVLFLLDYFVKSAIVQLPSGTALLTFGPFGIERLLNQHLFIWIPVSPIALLVLSIAVFVGVSGCIVYFLYKKQYTLAAPLILVWFGGASNVLDRLVHRSTIDYLKIAGLVGNIADLLVFIGLAWLLWRLQRAGTTQQATISR